MKSKALRNGIGDALNETMIRKTFVLITGLSISLVASLAYAGAGEGPTCIPATEGGLQQEARAIEQLKDAIDEGEGRLDCDMVSKRDGTGSLKMTLTEEPLLVFNSGDLSVNAPKVLDAKIEANKRFYTFLDMERASAIELTLLRQSATEWTGELVDIGSPGAESHSWRLSCVKKPHL